MNILQPLIPFILLPSRVKLDSKINKTTKRDLKL